jgi:hypothetical protein
MADSHRGNPGSILDPVGFVVDNVTLGKVFFENFGFPCQFSFHRTHLSPRVGTTGPLLAGEPSREQE